MIRAIKTRLYPTIEQEQKLWQSAGTARFIYNWVIARQEENYKNGDKFISNNTLRKEITQLKKDKFGWLNEVSNNIAKQAVKDACDAYFKFFKSLSDKPRFKSRKKSVPKFYNDTSKLKVKHNRVLLEKIGWVKIKPNQLPVSPYKYSNPRVRFDGKYWYLSVGIEFEIPKEELELTEETIGIDVGIKDLAICSNGKVFKNINKTSSVKKLEKKLRRLQRSVSRKYEMNKKGKEYVKTSNIVKLEKEIKLIYRRLKNIRVNHLHQTTNAIVKTKPSKIVVETLNIKGMMKNKHLSKAIASQKLYEFKRQLKYKSEWYGIEFAEADPWYPSSKLCSGCGHKKERLSLSERTYVCEACGLKIDRDLNASINLSKYESVA
jgi:putative transposase